MPVLSHRVNVVPDSVYSLTPPHAATFRSVSVRQKTKAVLLVRGVFASVQGDAVQTSFHTSTLASVPAPMSAATMLCHVASVPSEWRNLLALPTASRAHAGVEFATITSPRVGLAASVSVCDDERRLWLGAVSAEQVNAPVAAEKVATC